MCVYHVTNGELPKEELDLYCQQATAKYGKTPTLMTVTIDGEFLDIDYEFAPVPFHRIRRITGYLVGTLDRFNNGKRAEEQARVKHGLN